MKNERWNIFNVGFYLAIALVTAAALMVLPVKAEEEVDHSKELKIVIEQEPGKSYVEFITENWKGIGGNKNHLFFLNTVQVNNVGEFYEVFAMMKFIGEPKIVPGVGKNITYIISEGSMDCKRGFILPVRDIYLTDEFKIINIVKQRMGAGITSTAAEGTIGYAMAKEICPRSNI